MITQFVLGLDLGQTQDFTTLVILERTTMEPCGIAPPEYALRHLRRFLLGTAYTEIVPAVAVAAWLGEHAMRRLVLWV